ncbi:hypothetical protein JXB27_02960 [Candidatus Woesearchaeota archaeon]|nr:hypothetical protein [Candidatus Woesearchaeota archaeon]
MGMLEKVKDAGRQYECFYYDLLKAKLSVELFELVYSQNKKDTRGIFVASGEREKINAFLNQNPLPRYLVVQPRIDFQERSGINVVLASANDERTSLSKVSLSLFLEEKNKKSFLSGLISKLKH